MLKTELLAALAICLSAAPGIDANAATLTDYLGSAYRQNPTLAAERAQLRETDEKLAQVESNWRPTIEVDASRAFAHQQISGGNAVQNTLFLGRTPSVDYGATVSEMLFRGGRTLVESAEARDEIFAERARLLEVEQEVLLQVASDYAAVLRAQSVLRTRIDSERAFGDVLMGTRARYAGGEASRTDVGETEAAYQASVALRLGAEADFNSARFDLQRDTGMSAPDLVFDPVAVLPIRFNQPEAEALATKQNPNVLESLYHARAAQASIYVAAGQALPEVSVQGAFSHVDDGSFKHSRQDIESVQFQLKWRLYQGGLFESEAREAGQKQTYYIAKAAAARAQASELAAESWTRCTAARLTIAVLNSEIRARATVIEGTTLQQKAGTRTLFDVLQARRDYEEGQVRMAQAVYDETVQRYTLLSATGQLTARLLGLPVKLYDVDANYENARDSWFGYGVD